MRYQMTARTDKSDPGRYSPAYAMGRELGQNCEHFSPMGSAPMEVHGNKTTWKYDGVGVWEKYK